MTTTPTPKRYDLDAFDSMTACEDGSWIPYEDYETLRAENEILKQDTQRLLRMLGEEGAKVSQLEEALENVENALSQCISSRDRETRREIIHLLNYIREKTALGEKLES